MAFGSSNTLYELSSVQSFVHIFPIFDENRFILKFYFVILDMSVKWPFILKVVSMRATLQRKSPLCIPFLGIARPQPQFQHSCVCERRFIHIYSPGIGLHISSSRIGRPIVGIYKSLARMWKLGLRSRYSFSRIICFEISVFCLCSAGWVRKLGINICSVRIA